MSSRERSRLRALLDLRKRVEEGAIGDLAEAQKVLRRAEESARAARTRLADHLRRMQAHTTLECARRSGGRRAADAVAADSFRVRLAQERDRLESQLRARERTVEEARAVETTARASLAEATRNRKAVEKTEAEASAEARRSEQRREEEEAEEVAAHRRHR